MRASLMLAVSFLVGSCACAQSAAPHGGGKAWTVAEIFKKGEPTGAAPRLYAWSPDGSRATYLSEDTEHGRPNDVIAVNAAAAAASVLVAATRTAAIYNAANDERDRDHRSRYSQPSYHWSPNGKQMLFDTAGVLWMIDVAAGVPVKIADSGMGSGDDPKFS
ncbi:MAG: hypothetical protein ABI164_10740, partial [Acidobacteriaceae bacterium]